MRDLLAYVGGWVWFVGMMWLVYRRYFLGDRRPGKELLRDLRLQRPAGHHDGRDSHA